MCSGMFRNTFRGLRMLKYFHRHFWQNRAQSILEFTVLTIIIIAVFLSMSSYVKRGMQVRWKSAVDDFADQYDPQQTNSTAEYTADTESNTTITTPSNTTFRSDNTRSLEQRNSYMQVGQDGAF